MWVTPATIEAAQGEEVRAGLPLYSLWAERVRRRQWEWRGGVRAVTGITMDRLNEGEDDFSGRDSLRLRREGRNDD